MITRTLQMSFEQFARNERWGTCGHCPEIKGIGPLPELCEFTDRYDHHLDLDRLVDAYRRTGFVAT